MEKGRGGYHGLGPWRLRDFVSATRGQLAQPDVHNQVKFQAAIMAWLMSVIEGPVETTPGERQRTPAGELDGQGRVELDQPRSEDATVTS